MGAARNSVRYRLGARWYDVLSAERPVYRAGRVAAIEQLALCPGDRVLDLACGTGLNLPLVAEAVGPSGRIVGVDASAAMLRGAQRRVAAAGWDGVTLLRGNAARVGELVTGPFDAALFTYALGVIGPWRAAWDAALSVLRPGARVAVVDTAPPVGRARLLAPLAGLAFLTGGVHPSRRVWTLVLEGTSAPAHTVLRGGHVHVAVGTVRDGSDHG